MYGAHESKSDCRAGHGWPPEREGEACATPGRKQTINLFYLDSRNR